MLRPVLYAIDISAPLRERFFVAAQAARHCDVPAAVFEPFALSGELMMIAAFISDDIVDEGSERAGVPSVASAFGVGHAALAAEAILLLAERARNEPVIDLDDGRAISAARLFTDAGLALYRGQCRSITSNAAEMTLRQVQEMARLRAGCLFGACAAAPAVLAGDSAAARALFRYGEWLGVASQHRDDILDFIGNEDVLGKPTLQDVVNGQPNLVWTYLRTTSGDRALGRLIRAAAGRRGLPQRERRAIVHLARESDAVECSVEHLRGCTTNAIKALVELPPSEGIAVLRSVAELVGNLETQ